MYARRLDLGVEWGDVERFGREFEAAGFVRESRLGLGKVKVFGLKDFYDFMAPRMYADKLLLLREDLKPLFRDDRPAGDQPDSIRRSHEFSDRGRTD